MLAGFSRASVGGGGGGGVFQASAISDQLNTNFLIEFSDVTFPVFSLINEL